MSTEKIRIEDIDGENLDELEGLCIPQEKLDDPLFIEGNQLWRKWMKENLRKYGTVGKLAYLDSEIVGSIQYIPKIKQRVVEIKCDFVLEEGKEHGIREALLKETVKEFERPKPYFGGKRARALITYPFPGPRYDVKKSEFYRENGFRQVSDDYHLLYYPLKEDYEIVLEPRNIPVEDSDKGKALIFCNSSCPYCVKEMMETLKELRKLDADIPVKIIVPFEETEELSHVFSMPICLAINEKTIEYSLLGNERFVDEVKKVLMSERLIREPSTR